MGKEVFTLKPMNISSFIGDTVIDLTKAQIPYGETKIVISHFIGDVKIFVPEDMDLGISLTSSSFLGDMKLLGTKRGGFWEMRRRKLRTTKKPVRSSALLSVFLLAMSK